MWNERSPDEQIAWILNIEKKFPVETWKIDGVHIWPLLRIRLNLMAYAPASATSDTAGVSRRRWHPLTSAVKGIWALLKFTAAPLQNVPVVGADFVAHRALFNNKLIDKYFDPIFDSFEPRYRGLIVEYATPGDTNREYYKPARVVRFYEFRDLLQLIGLLKARFESPNYQLERYDEFIDILRAEGINITFYSKEIVRKTIAVIQSFKWFWKKLFKKSGTKVSIGLCYYNEPLYAMILAARDAHVVSVDLQHGGQGKQHLGYSQFTKIPNEGIYNLLPDYFWCWDDLSAGTVEQWISDTGANHKVIQEGHPWLMYMRNQKWPQLDGLGNIVMISLQPGRGDQPEDYLMDSHVAAAMRATATEFKWFVRLHPRQLHLRNVLKEQLRQLGILEHVEVDNAIDLPMPAILSRASVHLTKSSGSAIEAALLDVPNVILDDVGAAMFEGYIQQGQAILYVDNDPDELARVIRTLIEKRKSVPRRSEINDWEFILNLQ